MTSNQFKLVKKKAISRKKRKEEEEDDFSLNKKKMCRINNLKHGKRHKPQNDR